jgi:hypothetical protein
LKLQDDDEEEEEEESADDEVALCNLIKGTCLRELRELDEAHKCLETVRYLSIYLPSALCCIPPPLLIKIHS